MRTMRRRGFTLLEILMFSAVGMVVLYIGYEVFVSATKQGIDLDTKLKAVQGSQMLLERLERDLKHMVYEEGKFELEVSDEGDLVRFYVYDGYDRDLTDGEIPVHRREYRFDPSVSRVFIDGAPYNFAYFRAIEFSLDDVGNGEAGQRPILTMRVGGVADDRAQLPEEMLDLKTRADFVSSVGLSAIAIAKRNPYWKTSLRYRIGNAP